MYFFFQMGFIDSDGLGTWNPGFGYIYKSDFQNVNIYLWIYAACSYHKYTSFYVGQHHSEQIQLHLLL